MDPVWDFDTLRAWFAARAGEDVAETELLKEFFGRPLGGLSLELFQQHFLLYRRLWLFDDELRTRTGERLWIRGIRSTLLPPPPEGRCGWLGEDTGTYCLAPCRGRLCPAHSSTLPDAGSMKVYYLDWSHLEGMTDEKLTAMVSDFFQWMGRGDASEAFRTLGLAPDADAKTARARWRRLSREHHPDRGGDTAEFQRLSAAWAVLKPLF